MLPLIANVTGSQERQEYLRSPIGVSLVSVLGPNIHFFISTTAPHDSLETGYHRYQAWTPGPIQAFACFEFLHNRKNKEKPEAETFALTSNRGTLNTQSIYASLPAAPGSNLNTAEKFLPDFQAQCSFEKRCWLDKSELRLLTHSRVKQL